MGQIIWQAFLLYPPTLLTSVQIKPKNRLNRDGTYYLSGADAPLLFVPASTLYIIVQELCESQGGRPGLSVLTNLLVSVDVKNY